MPTNKQLQISGFDGGMRFYADMQKRNERTKESNERSRQSELEQRKKYYRPKHMTWIRRIPKGERIDDKPYDREKKVAWLTPWESFCYDVKYILKKIGGLMKWMTK
jgi:hypothetical protein